LQNVANNNNNRTNRSQIVANMEISGARPFGCCLIEAATTAASAAASAVISIWILWLLLLPLLLPLSLTLATNRRQERSY